MGDDTFLTVHNQKQAQKWRALKSHQHNTSAGLCYICVHVSSSQFSILSSKGR